MVMFWDYRDSLSHGLMVVVVVVGKLWTSPEILRENFPPPRGTQRGDVYSFSIVCFEVMMRSEPYSFDHMTARGKAILSTLPITSPTHLQPEGDTGHWCSYRGFNEPGSLTSREPQSEDPNETNKKIATRTKLT